VEIADWVRPETVLITGCGGMLGSAVYPYFEARYAEVLATDRDVDETWLETLDVRDSVRLKEVFEHLQPDLVLHLAAETNLEWCEENPTAAAEVNAHASRKVAELAEAYGSTLVYVSTAGVFDGGKEGFYTEADVPNPLMVYGQTKLDGEQYVRETCTRHYIVRAGWMVGGGYRKDHKFVFRILDQLAQGRKTIYAVQDKFGTPTYTRDFAHNLFALLDRRAYGLYHMVCEGSGSRYDVACELVRSCGLDEVEVVPVGSEFFREEFPAPRPRSEMMRNVALEGLGLNLMRPWQDALRDYLMREYLDPGLPADAALRRVRRAAGSEL
jgi:dTDP-4-dehydrorhamnose reductase